MEFDILENGNLRLTATDEERQEMLDCYADPDKGYPRAETMVAEGLHERLFFLSENLYANIGALTAAPILTDRLIIDGEHEPEPEDRFWWFRAYETIDPWETLAKSGEVVLQYAG